MSFAALFARVRKQGSAAWFGSAVLAGVQADSQRVWQSIVRDEADGVGRSWYKASIAIHADESATWTAKAVVAGGGDGRTFEFGPPPSL